MISSRTRATPTRTGRATSHPAPPPSTSSGKATTTYRYTQLVLDGLLHLPPHHQVLRAARQRLPTGTHNSYWTGYFTSRPTTKYFERQGNDYLQVHTTRTGRATSPPAPPPSTSSGKATTTYRYTQLGSGAFPRALDGHSR
ncbi:Alpha-mannosidase [Operophtera brumata]|uniref:Alpha-mannosidase n=1 Tax=Operophtera brumata TaxID=104452 RepID=A0A0L7LUG3_OPEBR|nr:Alpha-mannosidase [Operophtera brumata]